MCNRIKFFIYIDLTHLNARRCCSGNINIISRGIKQLNRKQLLPLENSIKELYICLK